jgi:hypothetical protein
MFVSRSSQDVSVFTRRAAQLLGLVCLLAPACTKSHDIELDDQSLTGGTGTRPTAGRAATGGRSGTAARGGSAAAGRGGSATGCNNCQPLSLAGFLTLPACCTEDNRCGADSTSLGAPGCVEIDAPGELDPACPGASLMGFLTLQGCCRPDGTCGVLDTFLGLGCTSGLTAEEVTCTPP